MKPDVINILDREELLKTLDRAEKGSQWSFIKLRWSIKILYAYIKLLEDVIEKSRNV